jgi:hypothetical protein
MVSFPQETLSLYHKKLTSQYKHQQTHTHTENQIEIDYRNILNCQLHQQEHENYELKLSFLRSSQDQQHLKLKTLTLIGRIENEHDTSSDAQKLAQNWVENLLLRSYEFKGEWSHSKT